MISKQYITTTTTTTTTSTKVCGEMLPGSVSDFLLIGRQPLSLIIGLKPTKSNSKLEI